MGIYKIDNFQKLDQETYIYLSVFSLHFWTGVSEPPDVRENCITAAAEPLSAACTTDDAHGQLVARLEWLTLRL